MDKRIHEFGRYPTFKGRAVIAMEMYRGWEIRRIAGGPDARVDCPTFYGVMKNSRQLPGNDIETKQHATIGLVKYRINKFQASEYAESKL